MIDNTIYDCIIVGGGPGGLYAGVYLSRFRCNIKLIDGNDSRAALIPRSHNYPGLIEGITGKDILNNLRRHFESYNNTIINDEVINIQNGTNFFTVETKNLTLYARNIILATGVKDIEPNLPKLTSAIKKGLIRHCLICDGYEVIDKNIAIIGQGIGLINEAILMQVYSAKVTVFLDDLILTEEMKKKAEHHHIPIVREEITEVFMEKDIIVALQTLNKKYTFDTIYSALGIKARTELALKLGAKCDKQKILIVDEHQKTTVPNLYAIGDMVDGLNQICVAFSQGAIAAAAIFKSLYIR